MSHFRRQGTVSKSSGPTHANSYAMKEVIVRYKTPIFVPELLTLPGNWVKPTLPSSRKFSYDYSLERKVAEQARQRAISIAAEASLQRQQIDAIRERHKKAMEGKEENTIDLALPSPVMSHPPFPSSMDILTPTPAAPPPITSQSSPTIGERGVAMTTAAGTAATAQSGSSSGEGDSSTSLIEDETQPAAGLDKKVFKSLGNWSIKEFEGDVMDPFEIASLQAINDMEELQSVLQQTQLPPSSAAPPPSSSCSPSPSSSTSTVVAVQGASSSTPVVSQSRVPAAASHHSASAVQSSPVLGTRLTSSANHLPSSVVGPHPPPSQAAAPSSSPRMLRTNVASSPAEGAVSAGGGAPLSSSPLTQSQFAAQMNPFQPTSAANIAMSSGNTNPFQASEPIPNNVHFATQVAGVSSTPDLRRQPQQQASQEVAQRGSSEPGVGTLVDLGDEGNASRPVPAPRVSPKVQRPQVPIPSSSSVVQGGVRPVPKPRQGSPAPQPRHTPPAAAAVATAAVVPTTANAQPPPPATQSGSGGGSKPGPARGPPPPVAPKTNSPKTTPARTNQGAANFTAGHNHVTMGIPVLPVLAPPTSSSQATPPSEPPPAYKQQATPSKKSSPPPPYSSPSTYQQRHQPRHQPPPIPPPQIPPKTYTYTLPDPEARLSVEQRQQVMTIAGMGFPPQRVGRAILRFDGDQTRVLDFLFLVGELEDAKYNGDSAETALTACKDKLDEAKTYLEKLGIYKEIGFQEKKIHEAYLTAKGDWDGALDILTRDR